MKHIQKILEHEKNQLQEDIQLKNKEISDIHVANSQLSSEITSFKESLKDLNSQRDLLIAQVNDLKEIEASHIVELNNAEKSRIEMQSLINSLNALSLDQQSKI